ncbi:MAG: DUF1570 domain-containing protein [Planctomycetales bacterium]|nr:DUF1570 domain-containing protein [Planctomycetales bacterium]
MAHGTTRRTRTTGTTTRGIAVAVGLGLSCVLVGTAGAQQAPKTAEAGPAAPKPLTVALSKTPHVDLRAGFRFFPPEGWAGTPAFTKGLGMGGAELTSTQGQIVAPTFYDWNAAGHPNGIIIYWNSSFSASLTDAASEMQAKFEAEGYVNKRWTMAGEETTKYRKFSESQVPVDGGPAVETVLIEEVPVFSGEGEEVKRRQAKAQDRQKTALLTTLVRGGKLFGIASFWTGKTQKRVTGTNLIEFLRKVATTFKVLSDTDMLGLKDKYGKNEVRCADWKIHQTPHYRIEYNCDDAFAKKLGMHLEAILGEYLKIWPLMKRIKQFRVKCFANLRGYHNGGGPWGSAGYFSPYQKELVTFKTEENMPIRSHETGETFDIPESEPGETSFHIMYHEAFHQYSRLYMGENRMDGDIPSWFNEGMGDYFFGGNFQKNGSIKIEENWWRVETVKNAVEKGTYHKIKTLVAMTQRDYYTMNPGLCYAQGWALNYYFLRGSPKMNPPMAPRYARIPGIMFDELEKHGNPQKATQAALAGIDLEKLDLEFCEFVRQLQQPARIREAKAKAEAKADEDQVALEAELAKKKGEEAKSDGFRCLLLKTTPDAKFRARKKTYTLEEAKKLVAEEVKAAGNAEKVLVRIYFPGSISVRSSADAMKQVQDVNNAIADLKKECEKLGVKDVEMMQKLRPRLSDEDDEE